jgi:hypothetical protein
MVSPHTSNGGSQEMRVQAHPPKSQTTQREPQKCGSLFLAKLALTLAWIVL